MGASLCFQCFDRLGGACQAVALRVSRQRGARAAQAQAGSDHGSLRSFWVGWSARKPRHLATVGVGSEGSVRGRDGTLDEIAETSVPLLMDLTADSELRKLGGRFVVEV